jgi:hypothetical protein
MSTECYDEFLLSTQALIHRFSACGLWNVASPKIMLISKIVFLEVTRCDLVAFQGTLQLCLQVEQWDSDFSETLVPAYQTKWHHNPEEDL